MKMYISPIATHAERLATFDYQQESSSRYGPGQQRRREYKWDVDIENHRFGRPGNLASPLCLDNGLEPPRRLVSKKLDDFRETQDTIGLVKNLGHDSREHLGKVCQGTMLPFFVGNICGHEPALTPLHYDTV